MEYDHRDFFVFLEEWLKKKESASASHGLDGTEYFGTIPSMLTINKAIQGALSHPLHPEGPYIIAVSGGPDSQCLLKAVSHVAGARNCLAVGVDHHLRDQSAKDLDIAEELALECGVEFRRVGVKVPRKPSIHAAAREIRYAVLFEIAREVGAPFVVTGHHRDDQVETLLIKLLRGVQPRPMKIHTTFSDEQVTVVRPLLMNTRTEIMKYLKRWRVQYATDLSNNNTRYLRAWVRNDLLPKMEKRSPKIREHIVDFLHQETVHYYEDRVYDELGGEGTDRETYRALVTELEGGDGHRGDEESHDLDPQDYNSTARSTSKRM